MRLEPAALGSRVKHSTTETLLSTHTHAHTRMHERTHANIFTYISSNGWHYGDRVPPITTKTDQKISKLFFLFVLKLCNFYLHLIFLQLPSENNLDFHRILNIKFDSSTVLTIVPPITTYIHEPLPQGGSMPLCSLKITH